MNDSDLKLWTTILVWKVIKFVKVSLNESWKLSHGIDESIVL